MVYASVLSHRLNESDRISRFSGELFIKLSCGIKPQMVYINNEGGSHKEICTPSDIYGEVYSLPILTSSESQIRIDKSNLCNKCKQDLLMYSSVPLFSYEGGTDINGLKQGAGTLIYRYFYKYYSYFLLNRSIMNILRV